MLMYAPRFGTEGRVAWLESSKVCRLSKAETGVVFGAITRGLIKFDLSKIINYDECISVMLVMLLVYYIIPKLANKTAYAL